MEKDPSADVSKFTVKEFFNLLASKKKEAVSVWENYLDYFALGLQNIILGIDPNGVVIGGEISRYPEFLIDALRDRMFSKNGFDEKDDVKIMASRLGMDATILGASLLPIQKIFA